MITAIYRARAYSGFQLQRSGEAWQQARWREQEAELLGAPISKRRLQSRESTLEVGCGYVIPLPVSWGVLAKPPQTGREPTVKHPSLRGAFLIQTTTPC